VCCECGHVGISVVCHCGQAFMYVHFHVPPISCVPPSWGTSCVCLCVCHLGVSLSLYMPTVGVHAHVCELLIPDRHFGDAPPSFCVCVCWCEHA
jgi:hypothetical protein